jgi:two-component system, LuxR family, response regulator FixJ
VNETLTNTGVIAIVDDDEPLREALRSVMKAAGFSARTFASAEEFLVRDDSNDTACLVLDVRLPGMSGIELQKELAEKHSQLPIIFVSAHSDASLRESMMRAGAAAFFCKPVRSDTLLNEIRRVLAETGTNKNEERN